MLVGALGLGAAELVAGLSTSLRSPIFDVGDRVVDNVPGAIKELAIDLFGTADKLALIIGIAIVLVAYSAAVGVVALRRSLRVGLAGVALFGVVGAAAALSGRADPPPTVVLPSLVGAAVAAAGLWAVASGAIVGLVADRTTVDGGRRRLLIDGVALAATAAAMGAAGRALSGRFADVGSQLAMRLPTARRPLAPIPETTQAQNAASFITSNADFYRIDTALTVPRVSLDDWTLRVTGMVDRELTLRYEDLVERTIVESDITLTCVSNTIGGNLIGTARWLGIRLDDLLDEAGIDAGADQIVGRSVDGYTCGFPVEALDGRDALVAIAMNGEPLPREHGFPARLIVPGIYGYASATKWLSEIELTTFDAFDHYWVPRGYSAKAPIKMQSRIDAPRGLDRIDAGPFVIGGVAWAQPTGIAAVEIRIDEGDWVACNLADELNGSTWRQWSYDWDATAGRHSIEVRATDHDGNVQTDERSEPLPDGASGHHTVVVLVG